jgi:hypothetical protein
MRVPHKLESFIASGHTDSWNQDILMFNLRSASIYLQRDMQPMYALEGTVDALRERLFASFLLMSIQRKLEGDDLSARQLLETAKIVAIPLKRRDEALECVTEVEQQF